jgi:hypothetical protein
MVTLVGRQEPAAGAGGSRGSRVVHSNCVLLTDGTVISVLEVAKFLQNVGGDNLR